MGSDETRARRWLEETTPGPPWTDASPEVARLFWHEWPAALRVGLGPSIAALRREGEYDTYTGEETYRHVRHRSGGEQYYGNVVVLAGKEVLARTLEPRTGALVAAAALADDRLRDPTEVAKWTTWVCSDETRALAWLDEVEDALAPRDTAGTLAPSELFERRKRLRASGTM